MKTDRMLSLVLICLITVAAIALRPVRAGQLPQTHDYKLLEPITHDNLTIFPVVAGRSYDTRDFITLDEGLRSGEVVVAERGRVRGLVRPRPGERPRPVYRPNDGAAVNELLLANNSDRPLLLLAGEIVTGGKQDRVVGRDRIVPAHSDPVDLSVFCVEPGRWTGASSYFNAGAGGGLLMAQPSVRAKAMADKDQQKVWNEVGRNNQALATVATESVQVTAAAPPVLSTTTSYATVNENKTVKQEVDKVAVPVQRSLESVLRELRAKNAVGVVVAVNGQIVWADLFASTDLLQRYWPKLARSYATEAITVRRVRDRADIKDAQDFLDRLTGKREVVESEPGVFRHAEITGDGYKVFELTSLLPKTGFDVHVAKMAD